MRTSHVLHAALLVMACSRSEVEPPQINKANAAKRASTKRAPTDTAPSQKPEGHFQPSEELTASDAPLEVDGLAAAEPKPLLAYYVVTRDAETLGPRVVVYDDGRVVRRDSGGFHDGTVAKEEAVKLAAEIHDSLLEVPRYLNRANTPHEDVRRVLARKGKAWKLVQVVGAGGAPESFDAAVQRIDKTAEAARAPWTPTHIGLDLWENKRARQSRKWPADLPPLPKNPLRSSSLYMFPAKHADRLRQFRKDAKDALLHKGRTWGFRVRDVHPSESYLDRVQRTVWALPFKLGASPIISAKTVTVTPENEDRRFVEARARTLGTPLRKCYESSLAAKQDIIGDVVLAADIAVDGTWTNVDVATTPPGTEGDARCFAAMIEGLQAKPLKDNEPVKVRVSYVIERG